MKVPLSASERQRGWVLGQSAKEIWAQPNCPRPFPQQGFLLSQPVYLSLDSAALVTLPPGAYTVQVDSTSHVGGTVLVEIYEVP